MQVPFLAPGDPLEKEMATHSRILALRFPWTEEPGGLQSIALQGTGHDGNNLAHTPALWVDSLPLSHQGILTLN